MNRDPVCGMNLEPGKAKSQREFEGHTYHFCSDECRKKFDTNPIQFAE